MQERILAVTNDQAWQGQLAALPPGGDHPRAFFVATTADEAAAMLAQGRFRAIVVDSDVGGVDGMQWLDEVARQDAECLRFLRGDAASGAAGLKHLGHAHGLIAPALDLDGLCALLDRALARSMWLPSDNAQRLMADVKRVPSPPDLYFQVVHELQSPYGSIDSVGLLIARDPALSGKILQLVNSAGFGLNRQITDMVEAVMHVGMERTQALMLLAHSFSYFDHVKGAGFSVDELWRHSLETGQFAQWIAAFEGAARDLGSQAYAAGLLHDLGKLVLAENFPVVFQQALQHAKTTGMPLWEAEREVTGVCHAEIGALLLSAWNLPDAVVEAVALHHQPAPLLSKTFSPLTAVHAANALARGRGVTGMDNDYLASLGLVRRAGEWREECQRRRTAAAES